MMIVEVIPITRRLVWVNTESKKKEEFAVLCDPLGENIQIGDSMRWDESICFWTPKFGHDEDVRLPRLEVLSVPKRRALELLREEYKRDELARRAGNGLPLPVR